MKSEFIGAYEIVGKAFQAAQDAGSFIKEHVICGAWGVVAEEMHVPTRPQAHIDYHTTPNNVIRSEE